MSRQIITVFQGDNMPRIAILLSDPASGIPTDLSLTFSAVLASVRKSGSPTKIIEDVTCEKVAGTSDAGIVIFKFPANITLDVGLYAMDFVVLAADPDTGETMRQTVENSIMLRVRATP